jgi:hypothetical protein
MANGKDDDGSSAPTRIREIRPAGKQEATREENAPKPIMSQEIGGGSSSPTMIRGYGREPQMAEKDTGAFDPVVGWLVVVEGPGRGKAVNIHAGMNSVGRSANQRISINFGDSTISGEAAAFITFEPKRCTFHINHGGKANIVYLNDEAVLTPMPLTPGNVVTIGATKLRFVALCGPDFNWEDEK